MSKAAMRKTSTPMTASSRSPTMCGRSMAICSGSRSSRCGWGGRSCGARKAFPKRTALASCGATAVMTARMTRCASRWEPGSSSKPGQALDRDRRLAGNRGPISSDSKESALKDQPTPSAIDQTLRARLSRAASLVNQSRLLEALDEIELCLRLAPQEEAVRRGAADILTRLRRPHEALPHVKAVAAMKSGVVEQAELAKTLDAIGQHREALAIYR